MSADCIHPNDRLADYDFPAHNAEQKRVWEAYHARKPIRVPMILGTNTRYFMFNPGANPRGLTFRDYLDDPDTMFEAQLAFKRWSRFNLRQDAELGLPEKWEITVDFQNFYEAAWFGCDIEYMNDQVPDTLPKFEDCPDQVMEKGYPDPFGGLLAKGLAYYRHFQSRAVGETYLGRPIKVALSGFSLGTDGPFTVACNLCGPTTICAMMIEEPRRLHELLGFITEANIARIRAWRKLAGLPEKPSGGFADDSVALISAEMYRDHILPHHRRFLNAIYNDEPRSIHLCGDATRHFVTIRDELNVRSFDTGFPIDFQRTRAQIGCDVQINGGPHVELLLSASREKVREETRRILQSGIMEGGRFVLREGNNLAPFTPIENTDAMYEACRALGRYAPGGETPQ